MGHFLQIPIARKTGPFLKTNHTISPDRNLQNRATFCKLRSQENLDHFSRKTTEFLLIAKCRNVPLSANYDRKKTSPFLKKNSTISRDHKMKNWATFCKLQSQEKPDHFSRKTIQFLVIQNCRNGPFSANYDRKKN